MGQEWAYCPDRNGVCATMIADAERATRDAARIAELGEECHQLRLMAEIAAAAENANAADLRRARAEIDRINAECNAWSNRAKVAEANLEVTRRNMQRDLRDAERENASLRRRLREGGR